MRHPLASWYPPQQVRHPLCGAACQCGRPQLRARLQGALLSRKRARHIRLHLALQPPADGGGQQLVTAAAGPATAALASSAGV